MLCISTAEENHQFRVALKPAKVIISELEDGSTIFFDNTFYFLGILHKIVSKQYPSFWEPERNAIEISLEGACPPRSS